MEDAPRPVRKEPAAHAAQAAVESMPVPLEYLPRAHWTHTIAALAPALIE